MADRAARFDALYRADPDPWGFCTSRYERAKYAATLAILPRARYALAIEAGCSISELTRRLARRCDQVIGLDVSAVAIATAIRRHGDRAGLGFMVEEVPAFWPDARADLIVLSEILYFLDAAEIGTLAERVAAGWAEGGDCVLVNYLGPTDETLAGDDACARFMAALAGLRPVTTLAAVRAPGYRLDLLRAAPRPAPEPGGRRLVDLATTDGGATMTRHPGQRDLPKGHEEETAIESGEAPQSGQAPPPARHQPPPDRGRHTPDKVEEASKESFPASDPPGFIP